jgi:PhnB protein
LFRPTRRSRSGSRGRRETLVGDDLHTVTPRIVAPEVKGLLEFLREVFDASGTYEERAPTMVRIGDSLLMLSEPGDRQPHTAFLYVYVGDVDQTFARAVEAGAKVIEAPLNTPYGDRRCMFEDPWNNTWQVATHIDDRV